MCDCCNAEGRDYKKRCGPGPELGRQGFIEFT